MKKVLYISSTGGHFTELMQLSETIKKTDYFIVTEKTKSSKSIEEKFKGQISFLVHTTKKNPLKYLFMGIFNIIKSFFIFLYIKPEIVVTTGAHTAGPMCLIAKFFGKKVIFIESFANKHSKSLAGKIIYKFADTFVVQHQEMLELYPNAIYLGGVF